MSIKFLLKSCLLAVVLAFQALQAGAAAYYIQKANPWGQTFNPTNMDGIFGAGNWTQGTYDLPVATIFDPGVSYVMLEGSGGDAVNSDALEAFLNANIIAIQDWVNNGGLLFINASPKNGFLNCGFGSTVITYNPLANAQMLDSGNVIFSGPHVPVTISYTGNYASHGTISGWGLKGILFDGNTCNVTLAAKQYGAGNVFFGGLTQPNWWNPSTEAVNLWYNIMDYTTHHVPLPVAYSANDSFATSIQSTCTGIKETIYTHNYMAGLSVKTYFGDNTMVTSFIQPGDCNFGKAEVTHDYLYNGTYTIRNIMAYGPTPIDSSHCTYTHAHCNSLQLRIYLDVNGNCAKENSEPINLGPALIEVDSNAVAIDTISVASGLYYRAYGNAGDVYTFKMISSPAGFHVGCPATGSLQYIIQGNNGSGVEDFGLVCNTGTNIDLSVHATILPTAITSQRGSIYVSNGYCQPSPATVSLTFSPKYSYYSADPAPASVSGNAITWNVATLKGTDAYPARLNFTLKNSANPLTAGDTVNEQITVTPLTGDVDQSNNLIIRVDTVRASCDPNLIAVKPEGNILAGTQLKYEIEFENVGNDTAHNIYVLDTLPDEVDVNSLRVLWATHTMYLAHYEAGGHHIVKWDFPNINLLDSSHHGECTGMFEYTINSKAGLPDGTFIDHRAGIYFDANGLVMTNTVRNIIGAPVAVENVNKGDKLLIYPNPASTELYVSMKGESMSSVQITNVLGQEVYKNNNEKKELRIDVSWLKSGVYFVKVNGQYTQKFIKK